MPDLKSLLAAAKSNLQDLESLLKKARSLDQSQNDASILNREEIQGYFEEILKIIEKIPENLKLEESLQRKEEITSLHLQMERVRDQVECSVGQLESAYEQNVRRLEDFIEALRVRFDSIAEKGQVSPTMSHTNDLLRQGKTSIENKDYSATMTIMNEALDVDPGNREAVTFLEEAQRKWEDQRLEEELVLHIDTLKKEAIQHFERGDYEESVVSFKFICELEPKNRTMHDYLELSQQRLQEIEDAETEKPAIENPANFIQPNQSGQEALVETRDCTLMQTAATLTALTETSGKPGTVQTISALQPSIESQAVATETCSDLGEAPVDFRGVLAELGETQMEADLSENAEVGSDLDSKALCGGSEEITWLQNTTLVPEAVSIRDFSESLSSQPAPIASEPNSLESTESTPSETNDETELEELKPKGWPIFLLAAVALVAGAVIGALLLRNPRTTLFNSLDIQSSPPGAIVLINGEIRGRSPLRLESLAPGSYSLRVEKEGYAPSSQAFVIESGKSAKITLQLQELEPQAPPPADPQQTAQDLFDRGRFLEAGRQCDLILDRDPQNQLALGLKDQIRKYYWRQSKTAQRNGRWEEARVAIENLLKVSPRDGEAVRELKNVRSKIKKPSDTSASVETEQERKIEELHQQISFAVNSGKFFPPSSGNASDLIKQLSGLAPADPFVKEKMEQILHENIRQIQRRVLSRDTDGAKAQARQLQNYFPNNNEVRDLHESLRAEEARQLESRNTLLQKAESSMARGNYVTPLNENALAYAIRFLALDPQNARAHLIKKESLSKAADAAKDLVRNEKFDEARGILSALLAVAQSEGRPLVAQEVKGQLEKLEFGVYPVIHDHAFGNCAGRLRMNGYVISYVPAVDSKDAFSAKLQEIVDVETGDKLKIQVKNRAYRFQPNLTKDKEENRQKLREISERLTSLMGKGRKSEGS